MPPSTNRRTLLTTPSPAAVANVDLWLVIDMEIFPLVLSLKEVNGGNGRQSQNNAHLLANGQNDVVLILGAHCYVHHGAWYNLRSVILEERSKCDSNQDQHCTEYGSRIPWYGQAHSARIKGDFVVALAGDFVVALASTPSINTARSTVECLVTVKHIWQGSRGISLLH
nr:hypothetical protein Iba_chr10dCG11960 [Ipomoea batatas]